MDVGVGPGLYSREVVDGTNVEFAVIARQVEAGARV